MPYKPTHPRSIWPGLLIALLCAVYASQVRLQQLHAWEESPDQYMAGDVPMMTTADAYYSLRYASKYKDGSYVAEDDDPLRLYQRQQYPRGESGLFPPEDLPQWLPQRQPKELPLLSWTLATAAPLFGGIPDAGIYLIPLLSSLFMIPLFSYLWRLGYPGAGILGGLVGTFSSMYFLRTSIGWVDTDALNLFFPWTASLLILLMRRDDRLSKLLLLSALLGATLYIYFRWYDKPGLTLAYGFTLLSYLLATKVRLKTIFLCLTAFLVMAGPMQTIKGFSNLHRLVSIYVFDRGPPDVGLAVEQWFPNVMHTISEVGHLHWSNVFTMILDQPYVAITGLLGFALLAIHHWRMIIPLLPLVAIGLLSFRSGQRFIMYLAPFVGIGLGYLITLAINGVLETSWMRRLLPQDRQSPPSDSPPVTTSLGQRSLGFLRQCRLRDVHIYAAVLLAFSLWLAPMTAIGYVPKPAINGTLYSTFLDLKDRLPKGSRLWTWWDNGFAIAYAAELGVYHDGAAQYTPQTHLIARSLVELSQTTLHNIINFVDNNGNNGIDALAGKVRSRDRFLEAIGNYQGPASDNNIYVLFSADMIYKIRAIHVVAGWHWQSQSQENDRYQKLACDSAKDNVLYCNGIDIDLNTGATSDGRHFRQSLIIRNGEIIATRDYPHDSSEYLQLMMKDNELVAVYLLNEQVFKSNFNQMFLLGRYDKTRFEEVYHHFLVARAFRVKPN